MQLSDVAIRKAKPREKPYKLSDGRGLYLLVYPNGRRGWRLKFRWLGKPDLMWGTRAAKRLFARPDVGYEVLAVIRSQT